MTQQAPIVTERAQIVFVFTTPQPTNIQRFNSAKRGRKEYERVKKAWQAWGDWCTRGALGNKKPPSRYTDVEGDMFSSCIDFTQIACMSFVDTEQRQKFVPYQG